MSAPHTPTPSQCAATAFDGRMTYPCSKLAKVERKGKSYCTIHDPVRVQARRDKSDAEFRAKSDKESARHQRISACLHACEGLADPSVVPELIGACKLAEYAFRVPAGERVKDELKALELLRAALAKAGR